MNTEKVRHDVMPEISIIIPVYNCAKYLGRCLDSLRDQTFQDWEAICIDDGSTDDSVKVLEDYAARDARVRVLAKTGAGTSSARNAGLDAAQAPFIMFCDGDDWYEPSMCARLLAAMRNGADMAVCGVQEVFGKGWKHKPLTQYFTLPVKGKHVASDSLFMRTNACVWNKIYRRELIERGSIRFPEGLRFEDEYFLAAYIAYVGCVTFLPEKLYFYYRHAGSFMDSYCRELHYHASDCIEVANLIWKYYEQHLLVEKHLPYLAHTWLRLCAGALSLAGNKRQLGDMENRALNFARRHIAPLPHLLPEHKQRLSLLAERRWVGTRSKWGGIFHCRCKDRVQPGNCVVTRKYYLLGIPCWVTKNEYGSVCAGGDAAL